MTIALPITREKILETARSLPAAPQVLGGLCELLQDTNADLDQVARQISIDAALAARVIRISNSAVFGGGLRVGSVDEAVNRVGFGEILRLVGTATVARVVDRALSCYDIEAEEMRESLLMHALSSEALARWTDLDPRRAYTGGLLRAIGLMVVDRIAHGRLPAEECFDARRFSTYVEWEGMNFGLGHTEVATIILTEWRFAPDLVGGIRDHLLLREADTENRLACVLNLAGAIVEDAGRALPGDRAHWVVTPEKLAAIGIDQDQWLASAGETRALFTRHRAALY